MDSMFLIIFLVLEFVGLTLDLLSTTLALDDLHSELLSLSFNIDNHEEDAPDDKTRVKMRNLRSNTQGTGPITGSGYFEINKSSFLSFLSFAATYIVILLQFRSTD